MIWRGRDGESDRGLGIERPATITRDNSCGSRKHAHGLAVCIVELVVAESSLAVYMYGLETAREG